LFCIRQSQIDTKLAYFSIFIPIFRKSDTESHASKTYYLLSTCHTYRQCSSPVCLSQLKNKAEFDNLAGLPLSGKYGQVSAVKVVDDLSSGKLYFVNNAFYKYHYEFCSAYLNDPSGLEDFNTLNYSGKDRNYLLANVNYFKSQDRFVLDISFIDLMSASHIVRLYKPVKEQFFVADKLFFFLNCPRLVALENSLKEQIPVVGSADIYSNQIYQSVSNYKGTGILRFVTNIDSLDQPLNGRDILVLNKTPGYFPTVSGIIITEFQTPLSHLSLLGLNRKIPICAYKNAFTDAEVLKYNHCKVSFEVNSDTFYLKPVDHLEAGARSTKKLKLKKDLSADSLISVNNLNKRSVSYVGNKAVNFGILYQLSKKGDFKVPESAFAISLPIRALTTTNW
jgi:pyruvate, water dikinase